jgi:hypothetical protein
VKIEEIGPSMQVGFIESNISNILKNKELFSDISKMLAALSSSIKQDSVLSEKSQSQDEEFDPQDGILRDDASDDEDDIKQRRLKSANYFTRSLKCVKVSSLLLFYTIISVTCRPFKDLCCSV